MNEQTQQLIRELAEKFGTTGEHLWGVLVRQAPITATIELALMAALVFGLALWFRFFKRWTKEDEFWEFNEELVPLVWGAWASCVMLAAVAILTVLPGTISAIINPEYWALKQILK